MPIRIRVKFFQEFYRDIGRGEIIVELDKPIKLRELVEYIDSKIKPGFAGKILTANGSLKYPVEITVNGRRIEFLQGLDTIVKDGDSVAFSPRALFSL